MNFKVVPNSYKGQRFFLEVIDEITNFMVMIPINQSGSEEIDPLIEHVFSKCSTPECIIMDLDSEFISTLINHLFKKLGL